MRTNIVIDDDLMAEAMRLTGAPTKRAVVEDGLRFLITRERQLQALKDLTGTGWDGDLDEMRTDLPP